MESVSPLEPVQFDLAGSDLVYLQVPSGWRTNMSLTLIENAVVSIVFPSCWKTSGSVDLTVAGRLITTVTTAVEEQLYVEGVTVIPPDFEPLLTK
jgi:hypothetical protein